MERGKRLRGNHIQARYQCAVISSHQLTHRVIQTHPASTASRQTDLEAERTARRVGIGTDGPFRFGLDSTSHYRRSLILLYRRQSKFRRLTTATIRSIGA